jgi:hypothetical protein
MLGAVLLAVMVFSLIWADIIPVMRPVSNPMTFLYPSKQELTRDGISIQATISSDQPFAERMPVRIHAVGSIGRGFAENVSQVQIYYRGAYLEKYLQPTVVGQPPSSVLGHPSAGVNLFVTETPPNEGQVLVSSEGAFLVGVEDAVVEWLKEGDYYPTLIIIFKNINYTTQDYPEYGLHVESYSTIESENTNLKGYWTEVGIFVLALVEVVLYTVSKLEKPRLKDRVGDAA